MLYVVRFRYVLCGFNCENLNGRGGFTTLLYTNDEKGMNFGCIIAPAVRKVRICWVSGVENVGQDQNIMKIEAYC